MPDTPQASRTVERYDLYVGRANVMVAKLSDLGISPGVDTIAYPIGGKWGTRRYADIAEVRLTGGGANNDKRAGICTITFKDGATLKVWPTNALAMPDPARRGALAAFVIDLHQRLLEGGFADAIAFHTGVEPGHETRDRIHYLLLILIFVVLPVGGLILSGRLESLLWSIVGLFFVWPIFTARKKYGQRDYDARQPPDMG